MKIRRLTDGGLNLRTSVTPHLQARVGRLMTISPEPEGPGFAETAGAAFMVDGVVADAASRVGDAISASSRPDAAGRSDIDRDTWNRFTYMKEKWAPEVLTQMDPFIRRGAFDEAMSPDEVEMKRMHIEKEIERRGAIEQGSTFGALVGSTAAGAVDLLALEILSGGTASGAAVGMAGRFSTRLGKTLYGAGAGILSNSIPELILHQTQELRTLEESIMAAGTGAVLGGGLGAFARTAHPASPLHAKNKSNPIAEHNLFNQEERIRVAGDETLEDLTPSEFDDSLSAARTEGPVVQKGFLPETAATRWLSKRTPLGRMLNYNSNTARRIFHNIVDFGGVRTDRTQTTTMEDFLEGYQYRTEALLDTLQQTWKNTNVEMGHSRAGVAVRSLDPTTKLQKGMVTRSEFEGVTQRLLHDDFRESDKAELVSKFGPAGAETIIRNAEKAKQFHLTENQRISEELKELGMLQDKAVLDKAVAERKALREQRKEAKKNVGDESAPADTGDIDAKITELDTVIERQRRLPEDLGDGYAHAQLYNRDAIRSRPEKFKEQLREKLRGDIPEDWLDENFGLSLDEFNALGVAEPKRKQILEEWFGDERLWKIDQAELKVKDAERIVKDDQTTLGQLARDLRLAGKEEVRLSAQEARARTARLTARHGELKAEAMKLREESNLLREAATGAREAGLQRQLDFPGDVSKSIKEAEAKGRAAEISKKLTQIERDMKTLQEAEAKWNRVVNAAEQSHQHLKANQQQLKKMLATLSKELGTDVKSLSAARKALAKSNRAPGLEKYLETLVKNLSENREIPSGALDTIVPESGRVKARRIKYTADERRAMESEGFLETDLSYITMLAHRQLNGHLSIDRGMKGMGYEGFGDWERMVDDIRQDYAAANTRAGDDRFNNELEQALLDLKTMKDRILGHEVVPSKGAEGYHWASKKLRQTTYMAMGSFMGASAVVDLGTMFFTHGAAGKLYMKSMKQTAKIMKDRLTKHPELRTEFERLVGALEVGSSAAMRANRMFELEDGVHPTRIGRPGSIGRKVADSVDYLFDAGVNATSNVSGLRPWNRMQTVASHLMTAHKLNDLLVLKSWDKLTPEEIGRLADVGLDKTDGQLLAKYLREHASFDKEVDVRFDEWTGTQGQEAQRLLIQAMHREATRAVIRPGMADRPRLLSTPVGQLWLQFQSFPFAFVSRFMQPASQRAANGEAARAVGGFISIMTLGGVVATLKAIGRGEDPVEMWEKKPAGQLAMEVIDRSGMTAFLAPYIAAGISITSPLREGTVFEHLGQSSRWQRNSALVNLLGGANFAQIERAGDVITSIASGDNGEKVVKKLERLAPFRTQFELMKHLTEVTGE